MARHGPARTRGSPAPADVGIARGVSAVIIRLPWQSSSLAPNRRNGKHWTATHAAKAAARDHAFMIGCLAAKAAEGFKAPDGDIPLSILFLTPDKRRRDLDGLLSSMKPALDGIAQALNLDDYRFRPILVDRAPGPKGGAVIVAVGVTIQSFTEVV